MIFSSSPLTELIRGLPATSFNASSIARGFALSIDIGASLTAWTASTAETIVSCSRQPGTPTLTSRISAPFFVSSIASRLIMVVLPFLISSCRSFFPVGFIRSPIINGRVFALSSTTFVLEDSLNAGTYFPLAGFLFFKTLFSSFMCSGVVPQHPPMRFTPSFANSTAYFANDLGLSGKYVLPLRNSGRPAFGWHEINLFVYGLISFIAFMSSFEPVEQFVPMISEPRLLNSTAKAEGEVP